LNRTDGRMVYGSATGFEREWMAARGRKLILGFGVRDNAYIVTTDVAIGPNPSPRHEEKPNMEVLAHYVPLGLSPTSLATSLPAAYPARPSRPSLIPIGEFVGDSSP